MMFPTAIDTAVSVPPPDVYILYRGQTSRALRTAVTRARMCDTTCRGMGVLGHRRLRVACSPSPIAAAHRTDGDPRAFLPSAADPTDMSDHDASDDAAGHAEEHDDGHGHEAHGDEGRVTSPMQVFGSSEVTTGLVVLVVGLVVVFGIPLLL